MPRASVSSFTVWRITPFPFGYHTFFNEVSGRRSCSTSPIVEMSRDVQAEFCIAVRLVAESTGSSTPNFVVVPSIRLRVRSSVPATSKRDPFIACKSIMRTRTDVELSPGLILSEKDRLCPHSQTASETQAVESHEIGLSCPVLRQ